MDFVTAPHKKKGCYNERFFRHSLGNRPPSAFQTDYFQKQSIQFIPCRIFAARNSLNPLIDFFYRSIQILIDDFDPGSQSQL